MTDLAELPEQAPLDVIVASRELLRGKVRTMQVLNAVLYTAIAVMYTFMASTNSSLANLPYWLFVTIAFLVGFATAALLTRRRAFSPERQRAAVERAWRRARSWSTSTRRTTLLTLAWIAGAIAFTAALMMVVTFISGGDHFFMYLGPLFGLTAALWAVRGLRTFRWATWFGPGAIDPDIAGELVRSFTKAKKVQYYAEVYAQNHPPTGEQSV
jgi:hypothetical protein